jgi:uncharacterized protein YegP (UPF0339 family)
MKIHVYRSSTPGRLWHFRITARNGKIVAQGEGYHRLGDVLKTLKSMFSQGPALLRNAEALVESHRLSLAKPGA